MFELGARFGSIFCAPDLCSGSNRFIESDQLCADSLRAAPRQFDSTGGSTCSSALPTWLGKSLRSRSSRACWRCCSAGSVDGTMFRSPAHGSLATHSGPWSSAFPCWCGLSSRLVPRPTMLANSTQQPTDRAITQPRDQATPRAARG